jgi:SAM-dependent methyltransferase
VAAGAGDVPRVVSGLMGRHGIQIHVTLLDRSGTHLLHRRNGENAIAADALALPFADGSFDLVSCCLFVHHLSPPDVVRFVNEALRVCRVALLINDLVRHPVHLALVYAGWPLYRSRLTRHDAVASVNAAYTLDEIQEILNQTRAKRVVMTRHYLFRMGVLVWK